MIYVTAILAIPKEAKNWSEPLTGLWSWFSLARGPNPGERITWSLDPLTTTTTFSFRGNRMSLSDWSMKRWKSEHLGNWPFCFVVWLCKKEVTDCHGKIRQFSRCLNWHPAVVPRFCVAQCMSSQVVNARNENERAKATECTVSICKLCGSALHRCVQCLWSFRLCVWWRLKRWKRRWASLKQICWSREHPKEGL